jgi:hypothetical protein
MTTRFLDWTTGALAAAAELLLDEAAERGVAGLSGETVVVPGARAGRRLKELLVEQAGSRGLRLLPPRVTTVGQLPELLFEQEAPPAGRGVSTLVWAQAARTQPPDRIGKLYGEVPSRSSLGEWVRIGQQLRTLHREVARSGRRFSDLAGIIRSTLAGELARGELERWAVLTDIQDEALRLLDREGLVDADMARIDALQRGRLRSEGEIWLVGITELPAITRRCLQAVGDQVTALVHAPASRAADFDAFGCLNVEAWAKAKVDLTPDEVCITDRPADQAVEVARAMAELADGRPPEDIVIGAPDPEVIPFVEERLASLGVSTRDGAGRDLRRTAPFRLLTTLAELLGQRRWEAFTAFVRHPDVERWLDTHLSGAPELATSSAPASTPASPPAGAWLGALDEWYNQHLPAEVPAAFGAKGFQGRTGKFGDHVAAVLRLAGDELIGDLAAEPSKRPVSAWVEPVLRLLERTYDGRTLDINSPEHRELTRALGELGSAIQGWTTLPASVDEACDVGSALKLFLGSAAQTSIPFAPDRESVEILGWLELHLDDAPITIVVGVNAPFLPESVQGDPFLSESLRVALELEQGALRLARELYRLTAMKASGRTLRLIGGRRSAAGDRLRPSPLMLADSRSDRVAQRLLTFYGGADEPGPPGASEAEAAERKLPEPAASKPDAPRGRAADGSPRPDPAAGRSSFALPPEALLTFIPPDSLSVTQFARALTDPYRFALERFRDCREVHDREREMNGALFGSLAHDVLEAFGRHVAVDSSDEGVIRAVLDDCLEEQVRTRFGPGARFAQVTVRLQVEQLRSRLHRFASWHAEWIAAGWAVQGVECRTPQGGARLDVDGVPFGVRARVDRVDYHAATDRWAVFDYKTSDAGDPPEKTHRTGPKDEKVWVDLQLPLYRWLLPRLVDPDGEPLFAGVSEDQVEVGYLRLPRTLDDVGDAIAEWSSDEYAGAMVTARAVVRTLRTGQVAFDPSITPKWPDPSMDALLGRTQLARAMDEADDADGGAE